MPDLTWYILDGHEVRPVDSIDFISTVFLGIPMPRPKPLLFETMIFGGKFGGWQGRCATWDEATAMHAKAVDMVKGSDSEAATDPPWGGR